MIFKISTKENSSMRISFMIEDSSWMEAFRRVIFELGLGDEIASEFNFVIRDDGKIEGFHSGKELRFLIEEVDENDVFEKGEEQFSLFDEAVKERSVEIERKEKKPPSPDVEFFDKVEVSERKHTESIQDEWLTDEVNTQDEPPKIKGEIEKGTDENVVYIDESELESYDDLPINEEVPLQEEGDKKVEDPGHITIDISEENLEKYFEDEEETDVSEEPEKEEDETDDESQWEIEVVEESEKSEFEEIESELANLKTYEENIEDALDFALFVIDKYVECELKSILLFDRKKGELKFEAAIGEAVSKKIYKVFFGSNDEFFKIVMKNKEVFFESDPSVLRKLFQRLVQKVPVKPVSAIAIPIVSKGKSYGALLFIASSNSLSQEHLKIGELSAAKIAEYLDYYEIIKGN